MLLEKQKEQTRHSVTFTQREPNDEQSSDRLLAPALVRHSTTLASAQINNPLSEREPGALRRMAKPPPTNYISVYEPVWLRKHLQNTRLSRGLQECGRRAPSRRNSCGRLCSDELQNVLEHVGQREAGWARAVFHVPAQKRRTLR